MVLGLQFKCLKKDYIGYKDSILRLTQNINPNISVDILEKRLEQMFRLPNFICFGFFMNSKLIGVSNGWISIHFYCGKRLELDNVIIDATHRSQGLGQKFIDKIEQYAIENKFDTVELNTYVGNSKSHKYYFNAGYSILGFHFQKKLKS